ncbi:hypothetical protein BDB00DRAFT_799572 [Zychaea mexicana]|uniref:uncharacterized protein n=1 Tax=Zychaea mexicana TaxID=64656 RepID=UPI0022FEAE59|nr:uncharacterized protein BDB00DRAFT_799572 [Zychaea mexicana]KAI9498802.1 hypothetical protein BDB00DRAFT_799572 [Zychaea mexicana]
MGGSSTLKAASCAIRSRRLMLFLLAAHMSTKVSGKNVAGARSCTQCSYCIGDRRRWRRSDESKATSQCRKPVMRRRVTSDIGEVIHQEVRTQK